MPQIPPFRRHAAPYAIECVCVGGGDHMHFEEFVCELSNPSYSLFS